MSDCAALQDERKSDNGGRRQFESSWSHSDRGPFTWGTIDGNDGVTDGWWDSRARSGQKIFLNSSLTFFQKDAFGSF